IAGKGYGVLSHVEDGGISGCVLILLDHNHAAFGLDPFDLLVAAGAALSRLDVARPRVLLVEDGEQLAAHLGIALEHMHVAGKRRLLVLLPDLQRGCPTFPGIVAILRKALQGIRRPLGLLLRARAGAVRRQPYGNRQRGKHSPSGRPDCAHGLRPSLVMTGPLPSSRRVTNTPRSKRMTSPDSATSIPLALIVQVAVFTSTGF